MPLNYDFGTIERGREQEHLQTGCRATVRKVEEQRLQVPCPVKRHKARPSPIRPPIDGGDHSDAAPHHICPVPTMSHGIRADLALCFLQPTKRNPGGLPILLGCFPASLSIARITSSIRTSSLRSSAINRVTFIGASVLNCA